MLRDGLVDTPNDLDADAIDAEVVLVAEAVGDMVAVEVHETVPLTGSDRDAVTSEVNDVDGDFDADRSFVAVADGSDGLADGSDGEPLIDGAIVVDGGGMGVALRPRE